MNLDTNQARAFRRRLALLVLLHRCPQSYEEIVISLRQDNLFASDHAADEAITARHQLYQFRKDLCTLKRLGPQIEFDRRSKCYVWQNSSFGFSLDQSQLHALGLLRDTFAKSTVPHTHDIRIFLSFLVEHLSPEQQKALNNSHRRVFNIDLRETTDYRNVDPKTLKEIERAIERSQQLEFTYHSAYTGKDFHHMIEPQSLQFKDGHVYLYGWNLEYQNEASFRLDRIVTGSAHMLRKPNARTHLRPRSYTLRYKLSAALARDRVSEHFPDQHVEQLSDGSAIITAQITNLSEARRLVLSYGINCVVLDPPELIAQMRMVRDHFVKMYPTPFE